mmetsp:Transcript_55714/g.156331  ORF Transcript_55714/g.156331 Transcript_55714/m.156331 type:complete len:220 (-) Transcript_55714:452-1111(-)
MNSPQGGSEALATTGAPTAASWAVGSKTDAPSACRPRPTRAEAARSKPGPLAASAARNGDGGRVPSSPEEVFRGPSPLNQLSAQSVAPEIAEPTSALPWRPALPVEAPVAPLPSWTSAEPPRLASGPLAAADNKLIFGELVHGGADGHRAFAAAAASADPLRTRRSDAKPANNSLMCASRTRSARSTSETASRISESWSSDNSTAPSALAGKGTPKATA